MDKNKTIEQWAIIKGYEKYSISSFGRIKSFRIYAEGKIMKTALDKAGYEFVYFGRKFFRVHRLVAITFIENPYNYPQVNHINAVRNYNRVENLEWCTSSQNCLHSYRLLNRKSPNVWLNKFGKNNPSSIPVIQKSANGDIISEYESLTDASGKTGIGVSSISISINKKVKTKGFIFERKNEIPSCKQRSPEYQG